MPVFKGTNGQGNVINWTSQGGKKQNTIFATEFTSETKRTAIYIVDDAPLNLGGRTLVAFYDPGKPITLTNDGKNYDVNLQKIITTDTDFKNTITSQTRYHVTSGLTIKNPDGSVGSSPSASQVNSLLGISNPPSTQPPAPDPQSPDPTQDPTQDPSTLASTVDPNADQGLQSLSTLTAEESTGEYSGPTRSYRYPLNPDPSNDYDYLKITVLKYVRSGFPTGTDNFSPESVNTRISESIANVILPMQPNISDSNSVDWASDELNPLQARFGGIAMNAITQAGNDVGGALRNFGQDIYNAIGDLANKQEMSSFISAYFAGQAVGANLLTRGTGMVVNPNLELLFRGPRLRTFRYSYRLTPREKKEAEQIKGIITLFKREMAIKRTPNKMFLTTPNVFKLQYLYKGSQPHPYLNIIKPCALTNFNVNYTPDGTYMTYADGGSMTSYQIDLEFSELEPIYKDDYDDEDSKKSMGY